MREALETVRPGDVAVRPEGISALSRRIGNMHSGDAFLTEDLVGPAAAVLCGAQLRRDYEEGRFVGLAHHISISSSSLGPQRFSASVSFVEAARFIRGYSVGWWRRCFNDDLVGGDDIRAIISGIRNELALLKEFPMDRESSVRAVSAFFERDVIPFLKAVVRSSDKITRRAVDQLLEFLDARGFLLNALSSVSDAAHAFSKVMMDAVTLLKGLVVLNRSLWEMRSDWFDGRTLSLARALMPDDSMTDEEKQVCVEGWMMGFGITSSHGVSVVRALGTDCYRIEFASENRHYVLAEYALHHLNRMMVFICNPLAEYARLTMLLKAVDVASRLTGFSDSVHSASLGDLDAIRSEALVHLDQLKSRLTNGGRPPNSPSPGRGRRGGAQKEAACPVSAFDGYGGGGVPSGPAPAARVRDIFPRTLNLFRR
jgi:hypothetical protein